MDTTSTSDAAPLSDIPAETGILIVGAGPTGLALAAELRRRGIAAVTIDSLAAGANTSRALAVHARTLEGLEPLGVVPQMLEEGLKVRFFRACDRDRVLFSVDFSGIPSAYPFALVYPQNRTEAVLLARLQSLGGAVIRPAALTGLEISADGVHASIACGGESRTIAAQFLVGCDGMHSRVREAAGIPFAGAAYEQGFVLADVHMDWPLAHDEGWIFLSPEGLLLVVPISADHYRIVATLDDASAQPSVPLVQALLDARGPQASKARIHDSVWSSRFRVHHRIAESPRKGRVLLCGDAAHVHSPAGGQGMNTGIQDAVALAAVLADGGQDAALDAWASERHKIAQDVVVMTDRMTQMATLRSPMARALRNAVIGLAGHIPPLGRAVARTVAELDNR